MFRNYADGVDYEHAVNIGIVGPSGTGKSSLVNSLVGAEIAATGITETTQESSGYSFNLNTDGIAPRSTLSDSFISSFLEEIPLFVWDVPGRGTPSHPDLTYYNANALFYMDCLIITCNERILDADLQLASKAVNCGQRVVFVRTRLDQTTDNLALDRFDTHWQDLGASQKAAILRDIKQTISHDPNMERIRQLDGWTDLFVISKFGLSDELALIPEQRSKWPRMDERKLLRFIARSITKKRHYIFDCCLN